VECPQCRTEKVERHLSLPARPQSAPAALRMTCNSDGPPCGAPWCRKQS
jgi:hypothetical protein